MLWIQTSSNVMAGIAFEFGASVGPTACTTPAILTVLLVFQQVTETGLKKQFA